MPLPALTALQFMVLEVLLKGDSSGRDIRSHLAAQKVKKSGPAFYQLMARMEDAGFVEGRYEQQIVDGQILRERWYKAKGAGLRAFNHTREFYGQRPVIAKGVAHG
jgi:DNA-binding PadR family transcriptional regulator